MDEISVVVTCEEGYFWHVENAWENIVVGKYHRLEISLLGNIIVGKNPNAEKPVLGFLRWEIFQIHDEKSALGSLRWDLVVDPEVCVLNLQVWTQLSVIKTGVPTSNADLEN